MKHFVTAASCSLILLATGCSNSQVDCEGSIQEATGADASSMQYYDVTCITSKLDKGESDGGE